MMMNLNMQEKDMIDRLENLVMKYDKNLQINSIRTHSQIIIFVDFIQHKYLCYYSMQDYKKPLIIGASIAGLAFLSLFVKNYIEESRFKPLVREDFIKLYKKLRKQNYLVLKQVAMVASQIASQFKQITPDMIKGYLEGPQSPIKVSEMFEKNVIKVCEANNVTAQQLQFNLNHYKEDPELKKLIDLSEKEFQVSLTGRIPSLPVKIPESLTKQRILQIQAKLIKQKYLFKIGVFRKLRKYTQQQLAQHPELVSGLPNPESEQQMLEQQNIGDDDQPASAVLHAAILKYRTDENFKMGLTSIENSFKNIYSRYEAKINNNKINQAELTELEDEIIYFQYI